VTPEEFVSSLRNVKKRGHNKWLCSCPSHNDDDPSLSVTTTPTGKILLHCFAGCSASSVVQSMGLSLEDLFPDAYAENPMAFAKREMIARAKKDDSDDFKVTWVAIALRQMADGQSLSVKDKEKFKAFSVYLRKHGLEGLVGKMAKHKIDHDLSGFIDFDSARYKHTVQMLKEDQNEVV